MATPPNPAAPARPAAPTSSSAPTALPLLPQKKKLYTLVVVHQAGPAPHSRRLLLGRKLRGFGLGFWNGYGGKVEPGEGVEAAAARELHEEAGVVALDLHRRGILTFEWVDQPGDPLWEVHVFGGTALDRGPVETDEMAPGWFEAALSADGRTVTGLPFDKMWADDPQWYPLMLGVVAGAGGGGGGDGCGGGQQGWSAPAADGTVGPLFVGSFRFRNMTELVGGGVERVGELPPLPAPA